jgi:hypothetical protein
LIWQEPSNLFLKKTSRMLPLAFGIPKRARVSER